MNITTTMQQQLVSALRRAVSPVGSRAMASPMVENSAYRFATEFGAGAVVIACGTIHANTATNWHINPKFGKFDHFQRWRLAT